MAVMSEVEGKFDRASSRYRYESKLKRGKRRNRDASRMVHISGCLFAWQAVLWKFGSKFGRGKSEGTLAASGQTYLPLAAEDKLSCHNEDKGSVKSHHASNSQQQASYGPRTANKGRLIC